MQNSGITLTGNPPSKYSLFLNIAVVGVASSLYLFYKHLRPQRVCFFFSAVLAIKKVSIFPFLVIKSVWFCTLVLNGMGFLEESTLSIRSKPLHNNKNNNKKNNHNDYIFLKCDWSRHKHLYFVLINLQSCNWPVGCNRTPLMGQSPGPIISDPLH